MGRVDPAARGGRLRERDEFVRLAPSPRGVDQACRNAARALLHGAFDVFCHGCAFAGRRRPASVLTEDEGSDRVVPDEGHRVGCRRSLGDGLAEPVEVGPVASFDLFDVPSTGCGEAAESAVADDDGGAALCDLELEPRLGDECRVVVGVGVDEPGCGDEVAVSSELSCVWAGGGRDGAESGDPAVGDDDVAVCRRRAGPVEDADVADDEVGCGHTIGRVALCRRSQLHSYSPTATGRASSRWLARRACRIVP